MFIAHIDERDVYDKSGRQLRDVNTLTDWLQQALSHKHHRQHKDRDDDNACYFHLLSPQPFFSPHFEVMKKPGTAEPICHAPALNEKGLQAGFYSIQSPPPKA